MPVNAKTQEYISDASLLFISIIWGSTFIIIKQSIQTLPLFSFLTLRFGLASVLLLPICWNRLRRLDKQVLIDGGRLGAVLFLTFAFQMLGLKDTPASITAFITGLYVVFVPILSAVFLKKPPRSHSLVGVALSGIGLGLITLNGKLILSSGEVCVLINSIFASVHIILTDFFSRRNDIFLLTTVQIVTVFFLSWIVAGLFEPYVLPAAWNSQWLFALVLTGALATVLAFLIQTGMQKYTTPTKAAIIFCMEPVSSAFFSYFIGGELLTIRQYLGALLIIAAMLFAEIGTYLRIKKESFQL